MKFYSTQNSQSCGLSVMRIDFNVFAGIHGSLRLSTGGIAGPSAGDGGCIEGYYIYIYIYRERERERIHV